MPELKRPNDLFKGLKRASTERPKKKPREPEEIRPIVTEGERTVTVALTMPRDLFDRYNAGKNRGRFRDAMVRQLERKFE
jgi:hypothetical protein